MVAEVLKGIAERVGVHAADLVELHAMPKTLVHRLCTEAGIVPTRGDCAAADGLIHEERARFLRECFEHNRSPRRAFDVVVEGWKGLDPSLEPPPREEVPSERKIERREDRKGRRLLRRLRSLPKSQRDLIAGKIDEEERMRSLMKSIESLSDEQRGLLEATVNKGEDHGD